MWKPPKWGRRLGIGLVVVLALAWCARAWVVPTLIISQIGSRHEGRVTIRGWWLDGNSAGVIGLTLHEGMQADSPAWATVGRVATDLSLRGLVRGRFTPGRVVLQSPRITLRLDRQGRPLTRLPVKSSAESGAPVPTVVVADGRATFRQEGRPELVVSSIHGSLAAVPSGGARLVARGDDPDRGRWDVVGAFAAGFREGQVDLTGRKIETSPEQVARIPVVPGEVWQNVIPRGLVDVRLTIRLASGTAQPIRVRTVVNLRQTALKLPALGLDLAETTGEVVVEGGVVHLDRLAGRAVGGRVGTTGMMDFSRTPPRFDLHLDLDRVAVAAAPEAWQLDERGMTGGQMTGKAQLVVTLAPGDVDLSGSSGEAVITGGMVHGVPVKSLRLIVHGDGADLRSGTGPRDRAGRGVAPVAHGEPPAGPRPSGGGMRLPESVSTEIELEDVDLSPLVAQAELRGIDLPAEVAGRLALKAEATIPLGALRDIKGYAFHSRLELSGASIAGADLGHVSAELALADGVLELTDLRGLLVDRPDGGGDRPPGPSATVSASGPLPPGGFRGGLRAELSPPGRLSARFEADQLPLGELVAPALPRPTPLSGLVSMEGEARVDVAALADPKAWAASGTLRGARITHRDRVLEAVSARFTLDGGRLAIPELAAELAGKPLAARLAADLSAPFAYEGQLDVTDWSLDDLLALVPGVPRPAPVGGRLTVRAQVQGTFAPWTVETRGGGHLEQFRAGPVLLGEVPFRWATEPGVVVISGIEATLFGGRLSAEARVPTSPGGRAEGTITLTGIDTAGLSAAMPGADLKLSGRADGRIRFAIPTARSAVADLVADVRLSAPDLTIRGVPARGARGSISVRGGVLAYDVQGDGLGGSVRFQGDLSLSGGPGAAPSHAKLQGSWFRLSDLWSSLGVTGPLTRLEGICGIAADLESLQDDSRRRGRAVGELRDLRWGEAPLGHLRGLAAIEPTSWRVRPLTGELLGGTVRGDLWRAADGPGPPRMGFDVQVERFHLARAVACLPGRREEEPVQGYGSVHLEGGLERAHGEVRIAQARVADLPLSELRVPLEWHFAPGSGLGTLRIRQWSARLAGGLIRGNAQVHLGAYQDYRGDLELSNVDLRAFSWISTDARRPPTGRISGRVRLDSPAPGGVRGIRGKVHLEVSDASLFELPVFRQINQFLGSEQGGIFEAGEVDLMVADRKVKIDRLALVGRLIQLRARGTIGFDARLDLEVIVRPNRVAPQTGRALASAMLGLSGARRRDEENVLRTTNRVSNGPVELRISGTVGEPTVAVDPSIDFGED